MKRTLHGALAVAGAAAALAAPTTAAAAGTAAPSGVACDKPAVECVEDVLVWLVTWDPCLTCEIRSVCEIVFRNCD